MLSVGATACVRCAGRHGHGISFDGVSQIMSDEWQVAFGTLETLSSAIRSTYATRVNAFGGRRGGGGDHGECAVRGSEAEDGGGCRVQQQFKSALCQSSPALDDRQRNGHFERL